MIYSTPVVKAKFLSRPNRFIALVELDGETVTVHVKNTGRCKELLPAGATVYLAVAENRAKAQRKTPYDLVAVEKIKPDGT
ncbi:MAG: DNA/RNA nuclease SfsA, partial [Clostridia bacterium]|nr:DNA/RNA nuclease SfsA [Clostridia bacterium]